MGSETDIFSTVRLALHKLLIQAPSTSRNSLCCACISTTHDIALQRLILLQRENFSRDASFPKHLDLYIVAGVDISLRSDDVNVLDHADSLLRGDGQLGVLAVLVSEKVVQNRNDEVLATAHCTIVISLEAAYCVITIHSALAFRINSSNEVKRVVWEKSAVI